MPKNALDNPLVLPILGLLVEHPRHPYAVFAELKRRYDFYRVRNATIYTLLNRLTEEGWIAPMADSADLTATDAGMAELAGRVREQIRADDLTGGPGFVTAVAYLGILPRAEAVTVLDERAELVRAEIDRLEHAVADAAGPEIHMIEAHYLLSRLRHDADWLTRTARRIDTGELDWLR